MRDDEARRHLEDLEKRVARLEKAVGPMTLAEAKESPFMAVASGQFCLCGRENCRAPACPTFQPDPLGR
jgi:hypothetical protein